jgi:hypothetical protein
MGNSAIANTSKNGLGALSGSNKQARVAQAAAEAEQQSRYAVTAEARAAAGRLNLAAQSPKQLQALEKSYEAAQTQVNADLRQLAAIDPAIMEASQQVLKLLQGETAAANKPIMAQRAQQRQELLNSLRAQYGPGAESSSIGQRALQQFDMQSDTMFQQNQMGTLGNLFGMATTKTGGVGFGQMLNVAEGLGGYQNRVLQAEGMGSQGVLGAMGNEVQGAAAHLTGDMLRANFQRQKYNDVSGDMRQMGRTWGTMGAGGKGGGGSTTPKASESAAGSGVFSNGEMSSGSQYGGGPTRQASPYFG